MPDIAPLVPKCTCGNSSFAEVPLVKISMTWICCTKCGAVIAYRDHILLDKLDELFEAARQKT